MRRGQPAARNAKKISTKVRTWCSETMQYVKGPGMHRCSACGKRIKAYPVFDDGYHSILGLPAGFGAETLKAGGKADAWYLGKHKTK